MSLDRNTENVNALLPDDYGSLIIQPLQEESLAVQVSNTIVTDKKTWRAPVLTADATASWTKEGEEIGQSDPTFDEIEVTPSKVANITVVSNELADDSSPDAEETIGRSVARGIATKIDEAYFADYTHTGADDPRPRGLEHLDEADVTLLEADAAWENMDPFADALALTEQEGGSVTNFVANPADFRALVKLKREAGSNEPLLGNDPTQAGRRVLLGVPLRISRFVVPGTIWGLDKRFANLVLRKDVEITTDRSVYFTRDMTAIRAIMRTGFAFPHPKTLAKIKLTGAGAMRIASTPEQESTDSTPKTTTASKTKATPTTA